MGLAASQARLLFITSRQNDVSAKMQRVSNQTMILARDEEEISDKYNKMLTRKGYKVADGASISYDALMGAQAMQTGNPMILTKPGKGVVLSQSLYNTMLGGSGLGTDGTAAQFRTKFPSAKAFADSIPGVSTEVLDAIDKIQGTEKAGDDDEDNTGKPSGVKLTADDILAEAAESSLNGNTQYRFNGDHSQIGSVDFNNFCKVSNNGVVKPTAGGDGSIQGLFGFSITNGNSNNNSTVDFGTQALSLNDLYNRAGTIQGTLYLGSSAAGSTPDYQSVKSNFRSFTALVGNSLLGAFKSMGGYDLDAVKKLIDEKNKALQAEYEGNISGTGNISDSINALGDRNGYGSWDDAFQEHNENSTAQSMIAASLFGSEGVKTIVATSSYSESGGDGNTWQFSVDAGRYVKFLVDSVKNAMLASDEEKPNRSDYKGLSGFINYTRDLAEWRENASVSTEYITTSSGSGPKCDNADMNTASYYIKMYNALAANGWYVESASLSASTINEQMKNGDYRIDDKPVGESSLYEEDASATKEDAENYYDKEMDKLRRKEKRLDTELSKLQTEYSSLTSDYESVKSIVTQNITKSFTYCQNG